MRKDFLKRIKAARAKRLTKLDLSNKWNADPGNKLTEIPPGVFDIEYLEELLLGKNLISSIPESISRLRNLKVLDLSGNNLTQIPDSIGQLSNLSSLNLSNNKLTQIPDSIGQLSNLSSLDLSNTGLTEVPDSIGQLSNLSSLDLRSNNLTQIPEWIGQLSNLSSLVLSGNKLTQIPDSIGQLSSLSFLDLSGSGLTQIPEWIGQLSNLSSLDLSFNNLTQIPDSIGQLSNLSSLALSSNNLTQIPEWIGQFSNLSSLDLSGSGLTQIPEWISQLSNLSSLALSANNLTQIPEWIGQLSNLSSLALSFNKLRQIPEWIGQLSNLSSLDLRSTGLTQIPEIIYTLPALQQLLLDSTDWMEGEQNQIRHVSPRILEMKNLQILKLENNPIATPPPDIVQKGVEAIKDYFRQLEAEGQDHLYEAKLLIVGEPGAGKTSLARKIKNPDYQLKEDEKSTEGIEVIQWEFQMKNGQPFRVNIWDFGGQEIYHATHQFFLTKRSLYALVADTRSENTDFDYWLNVVELLSDNSPLLVINNEKQDRHRKINERQLRGQFTNVKEFLATNLATKRGLPEILNQIEHHISNLPHIGSPLPKTWVRVREALENDSRNYIGLDEYLQICQQNGFTQMKDKLQLSGYLHDLGVCLHFQNDPLLKRTVILKPKWGTDAVYKALDNKKVFDNQGKFTRSDLAEIWHEEEYADMQDELLQLMINFKLCYQIEKTGLFIAPQLLTTDQPAYEWDEDENLIIRYTYEFMPKGIITQFIVAMHKLIAQQRLVWREGVILEQGETKAEVIEYYSKREIKVRVAGKHKKDLMTIATYELDKIHDSYNRLKYKKLIPCNCTECKNSQGPHFYIFEKLLKFKADREEKIQCQESYEMVDVRGLIDEVMTERIFDNEAIHFLDRAESKRAKMKMNLEPPKVFISYSHDSAQHEDRVLALADRLRDEGIDCNIDQYNPWPSEGWPRWMMNQLEWADIVLMICTETYGRRFLGKEPQGKGLGAKWEGAIITQELYEAELNNSKFIPVVFSESDNNHIPRVLRLVTRFDLSNESGYESLYRRLTDQPDIRKPALGKLRPLPARTRKESFSTDSDIKEDD